MEPSDEDFDKTHILYDSDGSIMLPLLPSTEQTAPRSSELIHSVLLAEGIHHHVTEDDLEDLPRRYEPGSSKARLTWFGSLCIAGIGMFVEAYIIITTGQIKTFWTAQDPTCWMPDQAQVCPQNIRCCGLFVNTPVDNVTGECIPQDPDFCTAQGTFPDEVLCSPALVGAISYTEFIGIMLGMLTFGAVADAIGRNRAGVLTSVLMLTGITLMTFFWWDSANTQATVFAIFFGVFGLGVGGEYPLTASGAAAHHAESAEEALLDDDERRRRRIIRDHERTVRRGETIGLVFSMQGVGAVVGSLFVLILLFFARQSRVQCDHPGANSAGSDAYALDSAWRSFYFIGGIFISLLLVYRGLVVEEDEGRNKMLERKQRREEKLGQGASCKWKILKFYAPRLLGTAGTWFWWDIVFYGTKLFSGPIFASLNPAGDLIVQNGYLLVNNICALLGYYAAAMIIDYPTIGRLKTQMVFFVINGVIFFATAAVFDTAGPQVLMTLFFLSSFFGQFINVTTYVMAAETYPTELRGTCHGLSAFSGKAGALIATIVFGQISTVEIFWICGTVSAVGLVFTFLFSVDLTRVSLAEHDAQLELFLEGRPEAYKGKLNAPEHLSFWERATGRHGEFDPKWARKLVQDIKQEAALP